MSKPASSDLRNQAARDAKGRFRPGRSGNPRGMAPGTRRRATLAAEALLDGEAEKLTRKAVELALAGDTTALRLCLERLLPPRRERFVSLNLAALDGAGDLAAAVMVLLKAVAAGELTPGEALAVAKLVELHRATAAEAPASSRDAIREMYRQEAEAFGRLSKGPPAPSGPAAEEG